MKKEPVDFPAIERDESSPHMATKILPHGHFISMVFWKYR
jgi:hypothetical protein